jgi:hypothetical protein
MPRIFTKTDLVRREVKGKEASEPAFKEGDYVMVILEECYIGDNKEWWVNGGEVNISFEFSTGTDKTVSKIFSTFTKVADQENLPIKEVVLLPPIKVRDHFSITVNAIELDASEATSIKSIMDTAGKVIDKVLDKVPIPGAGAVGSIVTGIVGDIVNLVASLNDDDVIIRQIVSYLVQYRYPDFPERHLTAGELIITETTTRTKQFFSDGDKSKDAAASQPQPVPESKPRQKGDSSNADKSKLSHVKLLIVKAQPPSEPEST